MGPNTKQTDDELTPDTPEDKAENIGEDEDAEHEDVQPVRPLRPGESIGGYTHD